MNTYAPIRKRAWPGSHPNLGALLGLIIMVVLVPYALDYGLMGLGLSLFAAGLAAGALARGGASGGLGAGARAAGIFMLILLISWALFLLQDRGLIDFASTPEMAEFVPYVMLMEGLWDQISLTLDPVLQGFIALAGGDLFVDLILHVVAPAIPAAIGGAVSGAAAGRPRPRPLPMAVNPHYVPPYNPQYQAVNPNPTPPAMDYVCPWCGLKVLPHMVQCWNCGGPLQLPPPPPY